MSSDTRNHEKRTDGPLIDVPEDFDLEEMLCTRSSTPDDERKRCPYENCGSRVIEPRQPQKPDGAVPPAGKYYCNKCQRSFDEPARGEGDE